MYYERKRVVLKMLYNSVEVEAIKLSVKNLENKNISSKEVLLRSIVYLEKNYLLNEKKEYLEKAVWHIYAYLELGFTYDDGKELFEKIFDYMGIRIVDIFPDRQWNSEKVILNKTNIRNILGRWNPVLHSMKIEDVVKDILVKVSNKEVGEHLYYCGKIIENTHDRILWEHTFKLYVDLSEAFLLDVNKNKYYMFREK